MRHGVRWISENEPGGVDEESQKPLEDNKPGPKANRHPLAFGIEASSIRGAAQQLLAASSRAVRLAHG